MSTRLSTPMSFLGSASLRGAGLIAVAALAACGGGGDSTASPSVSNLIVTTTSGLIGYGQVATLTVSGGNLTADGGITAAMEPGCGIMQRTTTGSGIVSQTFSCRINALGDVRVRVRNNGGTELASVRLDIPVPLVSMTVTQGTESGTMVIELDPAKAPVTAENFMFYVNTSGCYYRDTLFHRVIPNYIVQAGGYTNGLAAKVVGSPIVLESKNGLRNLRGTIAMARTQAPDSATSQFYFNVKDNPNLDYVNDENPGYAVFGRILPDVQQGLRVIDAIQAVPTTTVTAGGITFDDVPEDNVRISACSQIR